MTAMGCRSLRPSLLEVMKQCELFWKFRQIARLQRLRFVTCANSIIGMETNESILDATSLSHNEKALSLTWESMAMIYFLHSYVLRSSSTSSRPATVVGRRCRMLQR